MPALVRVVQFSSWSLTWLRRLFQIGRSKLRLGSGVFDFKVIAESLERAHPARAQRRCGDTSRQRRSTSVRDEASVVRA